MFELRIYQEKSVRTEPLEPSRGFTIGDGENGALPGAEVSLSCQRGMWRAKCTGGVLYEGREAGDVVLENGDLLVLNMKKHVALQLVEKEEEASACQVLDGLDELLIGRADNCGLQLTHKRVSGSHAKLYQMNGQWRICDINSTNGTFVNGKRVSESALREGDEIVIGPYDLTIREGKVLVYGKRGTVCLNRSSSDRGTPARREYPLFTRSPRLTRCLPQEELEVEAAPQIGGQPQINWLSTLLPSLGGVGLMLVVTVLTGMNPVSLLFSGPMAILGVVMTVINQPSVEGLFQKRGPQGGEI